MRYKLGFPYALLLLTLGCGGGGGGSSAPAGGGGPAPNNNGLNPPTATLQFSSPGFGGAQVATLMLQNTPPSESSGAATATAVALRTETLLPPPPHIVEDFHEHKDMPLELLRAELDEARSRPRVEPEIRPKFQELNEGAQQSFFISISNLTVTCQKMHADNETDHCTIFAEVGLQNFDKTKALEIAAAFDDDNPFSSDPGGIYDQVREIFGSEWTQNGGRDGDAKINLVFLSSNSIGGSNFFGFFRPVDEYSKATFATSNEGEILYLNADRLGSDNFDILGTIAHEFQHCISMNVKFLHQGAFDGSFENSAIDEGKSTLCEDLTGYGLVANGGGSSFVFNVCRRFLENPSRQSLFSFDQQGDGYGRPYTFLRYLVDRFGLNTFKAYTQAPNGVGLAQLRQSYPGIEGIFRDWSMATLADALSGPVPSQWRYTSDFNPRGTYNIRGLGSVTLPGWRPGNQASPPNGTTFSNLPPWTAGSTEYSNGDGSSLDVQVSGATTLSGRLLLENPRGTFVNSQ